MKDRYKLWDFRYCFLWLWLNFVVVDLAVAIKSDLITGVVFDISRSMAYVYAGWLLGSRSRVNVRSIAALAIALSFFDHIILKGGSFYLDAAIFEIHSYEFATSAFLGVLISYAIIFPLAVLFVYIGTRARLYLTIKK